MMHVGVGEDGPAAAYNQIARDLEVDALFEEKITAFHHFREDGIAPMRTIGRRWPPISTTLAPRCCRNC